MAFMGLAILHRMGILADWLRSAKKSVRKLRGKRMAHNVESYLALKYLDNVWDMLTTSPIALG